ncbi:hypothetical protein F4859DRAFT_278924 [Xylaria cf. heliscus]|nr:hypothetical protein F4859DRAFT_278924 [Xylaria cf. heliscus]
MATPVLRRGESQAPSTPPPKDDGEEKLRLKNDRKEKPQPKNDGEEKPRLCRICRSPAVWAITQPTNINGNAGRPYFRCPPCDKFLAFDDKRGIEETNPLCDCGEPSRRDLSGYRSKVPGRLFYTCSNGDCGYFDWCTDVTDEDHVADELAKMSFV